ncbi:hypothetical protein EDB89DRAFT_918690 [Lactarius sanguifluus]|nr:hypothetical protein EDB89DRAFT_918690 [Lactarius sanguifluus]
MTRCFRVVDLRVSIFIFHLTFSLNCMVIDSTSDCGPALRAGLCALAVSTGQSLCASSFALPLSNIFTWLRYRCCARQCIKPEVSNSHRTLHLCGAWAYQSDCWLSARKHRWKQGWKALPVSVSGLRTTLTHPRRPSASGPPGSSTPILSFHGQCATAGGFPTPTSSSSSTTAPRLVLSTVRGNTSEPVSRESNQGIRRTV